VFLSITTITTEEDIMNATTQRKIAHGVVVYHGVPIIETIMIRNYIMTDIGVHGIVSTIIEDVIGIIGTIDVIGITDTTAVANF
jgi:hypothetical protein